MRNPESIRILVSFPHLPGKQLTKTYRLVPRTVTVGPTPYSSAVAIEAVLNIALVNVMAKVRRVRIAVVTHLKLLDQFMGLREGSMSSKPITFGSLGGCCGGPEGAGAAGASALFSTSPLA